MSVELESTQKIRVLIADDEESMRAALKELVEFDEGLELAGTASHAEEAIQLIAETRPDVVLVDVRMPGGGGAHVTREGRKISPATNFLSLSAYADRGPIREMLSAGAVGYLVKGASLSEIAGAVVMAARGDTTLSRDAAPAVVEELVQHLGREQAATLRRRERLARVRQVLDTRSITSVFQPIVELSDGRTKGFEALSRFSEPPARPDEWFADAGAVGLEVDLEMLAIATALSSFEGLPEGSYLSLNVSPQTATSQRLAQTLSGYPMNRIVLEVTEHARVHDYEALSNALQPLRAAGARLAVDDAGAGFASLRHIVRLLPDIIKLDISLTRGIEKDRIQRALAHGLISFADEIVMTLVAEGIESAEEVETWQELGVHYGQGFYFGKPAALTVGARFH